jgi:hypothetical protein
MQSLGKKFYSFRADANALGGFLREPFEKNIPTLAPVSLPAVGGFAMARSEAFTFEEIVTCSSAYTRVSGSEHKDGSVSILVTAVVEGLNLLEVVTARRVVAQVSISVPTGNGPPRFSLTGSRFEGLLLAGRECRPKLNPRQEWLTHDPKSGNLLCSLIDGFEDADPVIPRGHVGEIPGFGRITLGQLLLTPDSVQLVAIRADLGCPVSGGVTVSCVGGGGTGEN